MGRRIAKNGAVKLPLNAMSAEPPESLDLETEEHTVMGEFPDKVGVHGT